VWSALSRGYKIKFVILNYALWKPLILKVLPSTQVLIWESGLTFDCQAVTTVFSDYDLSGSLSNIWNHVSDLVVLPRRTRIKLQGWESAKVELHHVDYGGVTNGSWVKHFYQPLGAPKVVLNLQAHRDARVILDSLANNGRPWVITPNVFSKTKWGCRNVTVN
jgi:hypothetical protein